MNPAPHANRVGLHESFFALFGGPIAWFLQLCSGYALASAPCFREGQRMTAPAAQLQWTWAAMIAAMAAAVIIAGLSFLVSWRAFERTKGEASGSSHELLEAGAGRTRFLALWGMLLGGGFGLATAITAAAFLWLPRCAG